MLEHNIGPSQQSLSSANFQANERDRALLATREVVRQRYGLDPKITLIANPGYTEPSSYTEQGAPLVFVNHMQIPIYSNEDGEKIEHHLVLQCTGRAHVDGSGSTVEVWSSFPVIHDLNWTVLQLRSGIAQMIEATGPAKPGEPLPIHLLGGDPKGFVIYNDLHKILLVQCIDSKQQGTPASEWKIFSEVERTIDNWRGSSGPVRLLNTLTVTFADKADSGVAVTLVLKRSGGMINNGVNGSLTMSNESRELTHYTAGFKEQPNANEAELLTTESAIRWPFLRLPLERL
jgi:hypothetical protein